MKKILAILLTAILATASIGGISAAAKTNDTQLKTQPDSITQKVITENFDEEMMPDDIIDVTLEMIQSEDCPVKFDKVNKSSENVNDENTSDNAIDIKLKLFQGNNFPVKFVGFGESSENNKDSGFVIDVDKFIVRTFEEIKEFVVNSVSSEKIDEEMIAGDIIGITLNTLHSNDFPVELFE